MRSALGTAGAISENPWERPIDPIDEAPEAAPAPSPTVSPHRGVAAARTGLAIDQTTVPGAPALVIVGCHGGAGESTLTSLIPGAAEGSHAWPAATDATVRVLLCARTNASGLEAAATALTQWAAGAVTVELVGLVLIADAARKLPRTLRERAQIIEGGAPTASRPPWITPARRHARRGEPSRAVRKLLEALET